MDLAETIACFADTEPSEPAPALLDWETVHEKMAWSVIIVLGGSFALADACKVSQIFRHPQNYTETLRDVASTRHSRQDMVCKK